MSDGPAEAFAGPGEDPTPSDVVDEGPAEFSDFIVDEDEAPVVAVTLTGLRENPNLVGASVHAIREALPDGYSLGVPDAE